MRWSDRYNPVLYGVVALVGAIVVVRLGIWLTVQVPIGAGPGTDDFMTWLGDNGATWFLRALAVLVLGSILGWLVVPWLLGAFLGWRRIPRTVVFQVALGIVAVPVAFWLYDRVASEWLVLVAVGAGVPTLARFLALRGVR